MIDVFFDCLIDVFQAWSNPAIATVEASQAYGLEISTPNTFETLFLTTAFEALPIIICKRAFQARPSYGSLIEKYDQN